jgi:hypothetical protein
MESQKNLSDCENLLKLLIFSTKNMKKAAEAAIERNFFVFFPNFISIRLPSMGQ